MSVVGGRLVSIQFKTKTQDHSEVTHRFSEMKKLFLKKQ